MRKIKIFLASSSELQTDRNKFETFISRQNKLLIDQNIFLELIVWEDFIDAISKTRLQDEYNRAIEDSDIFIMLFFTKVGKYTEEEFFVAYKKFKRDGRPVIFTYFKDANITTGVLNRKNIQSLWNFQDKLKELGHYVTNYSGIEHLKSHFQGQLQKMGYLENVRPKIQSEEEKKEDEIVLKFSDSIYSSDISIKKLSTVDLNKVRVAISWPKVLRDTTLNLDKLIKEAEDFDDENSTFYNCDEVLINTFYDSAISTRKRVETIMSNAPTRIDKLINGMTKYWGRFSHHSMHINSLRNYLTLCNMEMQSSLAYTLSHSIIRDKYFPLEYEIWLDYIDKEEKGIKKIFALNEEVYWADVSHVSGQYLNFCIWGKRSDIVEAYKKFNGNAVLNGWFVDFVIPQVELFMAERSLNLSIQYDEVVLITKIRDNNFNESYD